MTVTGILLSDGITFNTTTIVESPVISYTGYLVDLFCWNMTDHIAVDGANLVTNPEKHTVGCM